MIENTNEDQQIEVVDQNVQDEKMKKYEIAKAKFKEQLDKMTEKLHNSSKLKHGEGSKMTPERLAQAKKIMETLNKRRNKEPLFLERMRAEATGEEMPARKNPKLDKEFIERMKSHPLFSKFADKLIELQNKKEKEEQTEN